MNEESTTLKDKILAFCVVLLICLGTWKSLELGMLFFKNFCK